MKRILICILAAILLLPSPTMGADDDPFAWRWYEVDTNHRVHVNLFVFFRPGCPHCKDGLAFASALSPRHSWLRVWRYDVNHAGNAELYRRMSASLKRRAGTVPAFFYCNQLTLGYSSHRTTGKRIETNLIHCHDQLQKQIDERRRDEPGDLTTAPLMPEDPAAVFALWPAPQIRFVPPSLVMASLPDAQGRQDEESKIVASPALSEPSPKDPAKQPDFLPREQQPDLELPLEMPAPLPQEEESVEVPFWGKLKTGDLSLPAFTLIIAGCDAFNPCAFFVLLSLLSLLIHARSRTRMLLVGGIFVLFSGLFYFLFMAAWLNVFMLAGHLQLITVAAGLLAIAVALINIKDYFAYKRGVSLSIPEAAKPGLFQRMRQLVAATSLWPMLLGTLGLAAAANTYELLCTAGFPMVFTRVLTLRELPTAGYYGYLAFYNIVYVAPLAAIVLVFTLTLGARKLQEREGRLLKLLSGVMMLLLGVVILLAPRLLQSVLTAVALLAGAIGFTLLIVLVNRQWGRRQRRPLHSPSAKSRSLG